MDETRRSGPHDRPASHKTPGKESDTPKGTPPPPDTQYDEQVGDAAGYTTDPVTPDEWAATLEAVERGQLDPDEVEFPPGARPLAAIRSSRGGWRLLG